MVAPSVESATNTNNRGKNVHLAEKTGLSRPRPIASEIISFVRRTLGIRFEMRFEWEAHWWPVDAQEVAETLSGYYDSTERCFERLREGQELRSGLAYFRVRR
ncbi:MAG TPA: hypothetical protein VLD36_14890 [Burkholderiales bacterium]|nr:hypothetical protein [Burkholderiales bacterium]